MPSLLNSSVLTAQQSTTFTVSAGAGNRALFVYVHIEDADQSIDPDGCSIEGVQLVALPQATQGDDKGRWFYLLEADFPADGANDIDVVISGGVVSDVQVHILLFDGAAQAAPLTVEFNGANQSSPNFDITTTKDNALVLSGVGIGNNQTIDTTYGTMLALANDTSSRSRVTYLLDAGAAGAQTIGWTFGGTANRFVGGSIALQAADAPDTTDPTVTINTVHGTGPFTTVFDASGYNDLYDTITFVGTASDDVALDRVEVTVGATTVVATGTTTWSADIPLEGLDQGEHTVTAVAYDTSNNSATASATFKYAPNGMFVSVGGAPVAASVEVTP